MRANRRCLTGPDVARHVNSTGPALATGRLSEIQDQFDFADSAIELAGDFQRQHALIGEGEDFFMLRRRGINACR